MRKPDTVVPLPSLENLKTKLRHGALAFDSWINTSLYESTHSSGEAYERFNRAMHVFSVRGWKRFALDLTSEGVTLGTVGVIFLLALAQPAFNLVSDNWLKQQDLAVTFLDRYGTEIGRRGIKHDDSLKLDDFPDLMIKALLSTEDRRFYEHYGIDPIGTARALVSNSKGGGGTQGGSTLTQQLAKNLFLSNERSLERKINEAFLALWLENHQTKNEILKLYLDRAYMGGGTFGAVAAADYYFGKRLQDITLAEAAMLAGLFKAPTKYSPNVNLPAARARAVDVLHNMVEAGFVTEGQIQTALRNPATPITRTREITPEYYLDWAFNEVKKLADSGKLKNDRVLVVKTPLDIRIQKLADSAVETMLKRNGDSFNVDAMGIVVMDPDGAVRAIVGGTDYGESQFNRATDAKRQPGSSFKPYVYAAGVSSGQFKPETAVIDRPVCVGNWCPQNYGRSFTGRQPLWMAVAKSINTIPVQISIALGRDQFPKNDWLSAKRGRQKIIDLAHAMGVLTPLEDTPSMPLGADDITVMDQASGYAVFANGGRYARGYAASEIQNSAGEVIYKRADDEPPQVLTPAVVGDMNFMLNKVVDEGTARRAQLEGRKVAGKTGTTSGYRDAWFVGYTGNLVCAVWVGNDDHTASNKMTGGTLPAMTWHEIMAPAHEGLPIKPLPGLNERGKTPQQVAQTAAMPAGITDVHVAGRLSGKSFDVLTKLNGFFRNVETNLMSGDPTKADGAKAEPARFEPGRSGAARPEQVRPAGFPPAEVAQGGRFDAAR